jgi:uracil-DNA glycosylase family 4
MLPSLLKEIRACRICEEHLPLEPRPIIRANEKAKIMIVGQAPGTKVHQTGIPWNDPSGDRLRSWMGISRDEFYDEEKFAIAPMGFCYPGKVERGDMPPRPECAKHWRDKIHTALPNIKLTILSGKYAIDYYIGNAKKKTIAETVKNYKEYLPDFFPLPHPSPRNIMWFRKNPWLEDEVIPELKEAISRKL